VRNPTRKQIVPLLALAALSVGAAFAADPDFGPNVLVFKPSMPVAAIQEQINKVYQAQAAPEFGTGRSALLFWPGEYNVDIGVGYYMQVLGLGATPDAVNITGNLHAGPARGNQALVTFWRAAEGLAVKPSNGVLQWAVSQADPFRRMHVKGDLVLHLNNGYASGGWMSDCLIDGKVSSGPQQQWISRNTEWASWSGSNWNMVFVGVKNAPEGEWPRPAYTKVAEAPVTREKPFLQVDAAGKYSVRVPALRLNSVGISWHGGSTPGKDIPIEKFYIAQAGKDTAESINAQLAKGRNLILTPGIYKLTGTIHVTKANTVVLGLGMATLEPDNGQAAMTTADADGIIIAGILFDAGPVSSPVLLDVGVPKLQPKQPAAGGIRVGGDAPPLRLRSRLASVTRAANPISLHDVFFRVGGAAVGKAAVNLRIDSNDTILDHTWIWRADHGQNQSVGWTVNTSDNGLVVNGNNVTVYGLFVEHLQKYQVLWNGNGGRVYFYQSEIPYDPPDQASFTSAPGTNGWASYKVADYVTSHEAWGLGIYSVFRRPNVVLDRAIEVPNNPNVKFHDMITVCLANNGAIEHVINNTGDATTPNHIAQAPRITNFP
jgi:hypothetical protein